MKKLPFLLLFASVISLTVTAQDKKNFVTRMMTLRNLTCADIDYNAAVLVPKMYLENKIDTLDSVVVYWERNCGMSEPAASFSILYAIKKNTFNKQLAGIRARNFTDAAIADTAYFYKNIIPDLIAYKDVFDNRQSVDSFLNDAGIAFRNYYDFIYDMAVSLRHATDLSPLESFLARYYRNPDSTSLDELSGSRYDSTRVQKTYLTHRKYLNSLSGTDYALLGGVWIPQGNLARLTTSPYIGFLVGGKRNKWTIDFDFFLNFPVSNISTYMVSNNDSLSPSNTYLGFYSGLDIGYELFHKNKSEMDLLGTVALQGLYVLNGDNNSANLTLVSADPNIGVGYKFYFKHKVTYNPAGYFLSNSYLGIQVKYNFLFFNNYPGTSLSGNAITIGIIYGGTSKTRNYVNEDMRVGEE